MLCWISSTAAAALLPLLIEPTTPVELTSPQSLPTFGSHLALSDIHLLVSEPTEDKIGGVYLYALDTPQQVAQSFVPLVEPSDAALFGSSLELSDGLLVIGAPYENAMDMGNIGALYTYIFEGEQWQELPLAKLIPTVPTANDYFGHSLSLDGSMLVVGAPGSDAPPKFEVGRIHAYFWTGTSWTEQTVPAPQPFVSNAKLGSSVAISGPRLAAFAPGTGELIVFEQNLDAWVETQRLTTVDFEAAPCQASPVATPDSTWALDLKDDELLVGVPDYDSGATVGSAEGAVFAFDLVDGKFVCQQRIESLSPQEGEFFGFSVARHDDLMFIGAPGRGVRIPLSGAVYELTRADQIWTVTQGPLEAEVQDISDTFGCSLALSGQHLAVSACHPSTPKVTLFELKGSLGESCGLDVDCASAICADGVCCNDTLCVDSQCWRCDAGPTPGYCAIDEGAECDAGVGCDVEAAICASPDETSGGTGSGLPDESSSSGEVPTTSSDEGMTSSGLPPDPTHTSSTASESGPHTGVGGELPGLFDGCACRSSSAGLQWLWLAVLFLFRGRTRRYE